MARTTWNWERFFTLLCVLALSTSVFLAKGDLSTLPTTDASDHAEIAISATAHHSFSWPVSAPGHPTPQGIYNDHPWIDYFLLGNVLRFFNPGSWSARLLPALFSTVCVLFTVILGIELHSFSLGILASIILLFSKPFWIDGTNNHLDNWMSVFIVLSFILFSKKRPILAAISCGIGTWFKTPVAFLALPTFFIEEWLKSTPRLHGLSILKLIFKYKLWGIIALIVGSLTWLYLGFRFGWNWVEDYWSRQLLGTAISGRGLGLNWDPFEFFRVAKSQYLPWVYLLVPALIFCILNSKIRKSRAFAVPAIGSFVLIAIVSLLRFKFGHYFTPVYPLLSLLIVLPVSDFLERKENYVNCLIQGFSLVTITVLLCTPINPSPESFPALRKFMAVINSSGFCGDSVAYVDGFGPYGVFEDYQHLLGFYSQAPTIHSTCADISKLISSTSLHWILINKAHYTQCLSKENRETFSSTFMYRQQMLLTDRIVPVPQKNSKIISLTDFSPLAFELRPLVDCKISTQIEERYHGTAN